MLNRLFLLMAKQTKQKQLKQRQSAQAMSESIPVPSGIEFSVSGRVLTAKKDSKEISRKIPFGMSIEFKEGKLNLTALKSRKAERRMIGTMIAHIKNIILGFTEGFEYELEICNIHFPITVAYDKAKKEFSIKNLLGEKAPRTISSFGSIEVEIKAPKIKIKSFDLEAAGQTAANLEKVSKIKNRDRNKFQDGIFITKKPGAVFS